MFFFDWLIDWLVGQSKLCHRPQVARGPEFEYHWTRLPYGIDWCLWSNDTRCMFYSYIFCSFCLLSSGNVMGPVLYISSHGGQSHGHFSIFFCFLIKYKYKLELNWLKTTPMPYHDIKASRIPDDIDLIWRYIPQPYHNVLYLYYITFWAVLLEQEL